MNDAAAIPAPNRLKFWGVRGSIPTPGPATVHYGGNTSCVELRADGQHIILDAGSGIRPLGLELAAEFKGRPVELTLLITHTHWDHIQGFPFFAPAYNPQNKLRVLGYEGARHGLEATLSGQMESTYFPIGFRQMPGHIVISELKDFSFQVGPLKCGAAFMNHPGICVGFRVETSGGTVAYLPDHEPFQSLRIPPGAPPENLTEMLDYVRAEDDRMAEFIRGADILISDSQYDAAEYQDHIGWGHSAVEDAVALALKGQVRRLYLFHHDPCHDDVFVTRMLERAREIARKAGSNLEIEAAREGLEVPLTFRAGSA